MRTGIVPTPTVGLTTAADALRDEEVERTRGFIRIGWIVAAFAIVAAQLLPGDRELAHLLAGAIGVTAVASLVVERALVGAQEVRGVEKMPFEFIFKHMDQFAIDLGGASGSLGNQNDVSVFKTQKHTIAPVICYESIYGKYVGKYVRKGADLIFIITNDGWWGNTPGYRQHLQYARSRAIEMRRSIARSANTGISCFINQKGDIIQQAQWWQTDVLKQTINANTTMTVYAGIGDIIAIVSCLLSLIALLWCGAITFRNKAN